MFEGSATVSVAELPDRRDEPAPGYDRTPPQDVAAEQSVLGGMLLSKDAIADVVEVLRGHDMYRPAHETIYEAIEDRDPELAELMMRRHIARARLRRLEAMGFSSAATPEALTRTP